MCILELELAVSSYQHIYLTNVGFYFIIIHNINTNQEVYNKENQ